jgi:rubrerythrin
MSREKIEVITYEQDRLNYFTDLMEKAQKRYKQLFKKYKDAPYVSEEAQMLSDAGRETHFLGDVVEMLEKGYRKQIEGEWKKVYDKAPRYVCTSCNHLYNNKEYKYCPNCGAKMKGGE